MDSFGLLGMTKAVLSPSVFAYNNRIAVEPFKSKGLEQKISNGFATITQQVELIPLRVVFGSSPTADRDSIHSGSVVYVRGDATRHQWAKEVHEVAGEKFIFLPLDAVVLVDIMGRTVSMDLKED